jgi:AhpD family alkylhydroperoxidase
MISDYPACYRRVAEMMDAYGVESPGVMEGFAQLHSASVADGALSSKLKELIALAIGITVRCDGCIAFHVHDALNAGATRKEVAETVGVAIMMGGGPSVVYGCQPLEALEQSEESRVGG